MYNTKLSNSLMLMNLLGVHPIAREESSGWKLCQGLTLSLILGYLA